ncbi:MAG: phthalate 4,5-dioxygenase [Chloroflexi bacterium]|nr:phthalate 4,5-dioxygenase [Chloroflexota bacterium]
MTSQEENELLTHTGPGTPGGDLMRRFWQPVALYDELPTGSAPIPVRLLGQDLVLFRDERGQPGLLGLHCAHRGADLSYGRIEDGGLRCIYHGWLYDVHGRCLEQPGEPAGSTFHERIRQTAYACIEQCGLIFAYLGPGQPPLLPAYEFLSAPKERRFATKYFQECNYLQGNEGNLDQTHFSFLHRRLHYGPEDHGAYVIEDVAPTLEPEETDFGIRVYSVRHLRSGRNHVKISNFLPPNVAAFSGGIRDGYSVHYHVPIDDTHHWKYLLHFSRSAPLGERTGQVFGAELGPDYRLRLTKANRYLQDREEMKAATFSGMGDFFHAQDACVTEGAGTIQDRTGEHVAYSDRAIVVARKILLQAIRDVQAGRDPHYVIRDESENLFPELVARADELSGDVDWHEHWKTVPKHQHVGAPA